MSKLALIFAGLLVMATPASAELINIDNTALQTLIEKGTPVIDIRRPDEWKETGIIKDSKLLTFFDQKNRYDAEKWLADLSKMINPEEPFVLICHSGGRTSMVGKWLGKNFAEVYNVEEGIVDWLKKGMETVSVPVDEN